MTTFFANIAVSFDSQAIRMSDKFEFRACKVYILEWQHNLLK